MDVSSRAGATILVALGGLCLGTGLALFAPLGWPFELFAHFRLQYAAAGLLLAILLLGLRRPGPAALSALVAVFHALPTLQATVAGEPVLACGRTSFTVATANLLYRNRDRSGFTDWLASQPADLIVVQEVSPEWAGALAGQTGYPYRKLFARSDAYGIGVLSRWPLLEVGARDLAGDGLPSLYGRIAVGGREIRFIGLHARWPVLPQLAKQRDASLRAAAELACADSSPVVALGDLNLTPYSPEFAAFLRASGLRDAMHGGLWQPTWQAGFWPLALRIDHVLVSPGLCVEHAEVGPDIGSDHRPVIVRLGVAGAHVEPGVAAVIPAPASPRLAAGTRGSSR